MSNPNPTHKFAPGEGGRPRGAKNRLQGSFIAALAKDFEVHGATIVARCREEKPDQYLRVIAAVLPKSEPVPFPGLGDSPSDNAREVVKALADGEISPDDAGAVLAAFASQMRIVEVAEIEKRLALVEAEQERARGKS